MKKKRKVNPDKPGRLRKHEAWTPLTGEQKYVLMHINFVSIKAVNQGGGSKRWLEFQAELFGKDVTSEVSILYGRRIIEGYRSELTKRVRYRAVSMEMWQAALDNSLYAMI